MQQTAEVGDVDGGAGALGDRLRAARDGGGVQVQVADRAATVAGRAWKKRNVAASIASWAIALAADERDGGADAAGAQGARAGRRVGVAQEVGGQALVGLERRDHVADAGVLALGDGLNAAHRGAEDGQPTELFDRDGEPMLGRGLARSCRRCHVWDHEALVSASTDVGPVLREISGGRARLGAMRPYEGLLTAMVTPFKADGGVNEEAAVALGGHLLSNGSNGLVVCGTTGESPTLSDDEMVALVTTMVEELGGEGTVVAGAGSNNTHHAAHLAERMAQAGAEALLSVTGYYNRPNRRGIIRHYEEVARAAAGTPVIVYNIPSRTTINIDRELLAELGQIDGIDAVKQSHTPDLGPIDGLTVLTGNDQDLARALDLGCAGGICVSSPHRRQRDAAHVR